MYVGVKGYAYCLYPNIHEGLVGWVSAQEPRVFLEEKHLFHRPFCGTNFWSPFFVGKTKAGKTSIASS